MQRLEREALTSPAQPPDARLEGARVAARGIAHTLNNDLTQALGRISLVAIRDDLPAAARADLLQAEGALRRLHRHLEQFQRIERLVTRDTPDGPLLELEHSIQREPPGA
jgi:hypothetical protein